tara:strand:+ start:8915 stop:9094 length:180 start_codon:yes stop_codon:yes gene_type:complete
MVSDNRRNRRKNQRDKHLSKNEITKKDKIVGVLAIIIIVILATVMAYYYSLSKAGMSLF